MKQVKETQIFYCSAMSLERFHLSGLTEALNTLTNAENGGSMNSI